jgi:hypothetical protein
MSGFARVLQSCEGALCCSDAQKNSPGHTAPKQILICDVWEKDLARRISFWRKLLFAQLYQGSIFT